LSICQVVWTSLGAADALAGMAIAAMAAKSRPAKRTKGRSNMAPRPRANANDYQ
jgi:hypothetical protein